MTDRTRWKWKEIPSQYLKLCKIRISLLSACSALPGYILAGSGIKGGLLIPWAGVLILACGACALNQYQERGIDLRMARTSQRPIPSGSIQPLQALVFSLLLMGIGFWILAMSGSVAPILGLSAVAWYNGVYTYLKRISPFAAVPGALTGALPPAIGWACGGGHFADVRLYALCLFFFMWQVPHFWLLLLGRGGEYKETGLLTLADLFSEGQLRRIVSQWIFGTAACSLLISLYGPVQASFTGYALLGVSLWLGYQGMRFRRKSGPASLVLFRKMNHYMLVVLLLLSLDWLPVRFPFWR